MDDSERSFLPKAITPGLESSRPSVLVARGLERLRYGQLTSTLERPTGVVLSIATQLEHSIRRSAKETKASGKSRTYLTARQEDLVACLVYATANARNPVQREASNALLRIIGFMDKSGLYNWFAILGLH